MKLQMSKYLSDCFKVFIYCLIVLMIKGQRQIDNQGSGKSNILRFLQISVLGKVYSNTGLR